MNLKAGCISSQALLKRGNHGTLPNSVPRMLDRDKNRDRSDELYHLIILIRSRVIVSYRLSHKLISNTNSQAFDHKRF